MRHGLGFVNSCAAGLMVGAAAGMVLVTGKQSRKTQIGKRLQKAGIAVDRTVSKMVSGW